MNSEIKKQKEEDFEKFDAIPESLKVLKVKDPPAIKQKPLHPHCPEPPSLLLMISPIRTGKSTIISNLLLNSDFYGQNYFDEVNIISPTIYNCKTSRFLKKAFDCYDEYSDELIQGIVEKQKAYPDPDERPDIEIVLDDIIGIVRREAYLNHLASRFRHYNIKLLLMSSQNYRAVSPVIRSNCTHMIVGSPFPNTKELGKIAEEVGDQFGGADNFLAIYRKATPQKYDFLYLDLTSNPPLAYHNFEEVIAQGGQGYSEAVASADLNMSSMPKTETK